MLNDIWLRGYRILQMFSLPLINKRKWNCTSIQLRKGKMKLPWIHVILCHVETYHTFVHGNRGIKDEGGFLQKWLFDFYFISKIVLCTKITVKVLIYLKTKLKWFWTFLSSSFLKRVITHMICFSLFFKVGI